jgi:2-C-methyl-D-erythritol 2,4-cyclodiphosphate synthase
MPDAPRLDTLPRIGLGVDRHAFDRARRLTLGGVAIPGAPGLRGHSDADVLAHAVCDALLGALGLPDMGMRFKDTDRRWRGRSSLFFIRDAMRDVRRRGLAVGNLDSVLLAETPRLAPHIAAMRRRLSGALGCDPAVVSVKPKRGEGLGFVGRREGMAAQAIVLLIPAASAPAAKRRIPRHTTRRGAGRTTTRVTRRRARSGRR